MIPFMKFLLSENAISSKIGADKTEAHTKKYLNPEVMGSSLYNVAKSNPHVPVGSKVKVSNPRPHEGHIVVDVEHDGKTHTLKADRLDKPAGVGGSGPRGAGGNPEELEDRQIAEIQQSIHKAISDNKGRPINMRHPNGSTTEVAGIKKVTDGKPKADAYLHDSKGNPVHWMSLKGKKFQQWGGTKGISEHPTMKKALEALQTVKKTFHPGQRALPSGAAYHYSLDPENNPEDRDMIHKTMYGIDHGKSHGPNNVHAIYSGDTIGIKKTSHPSGSEYEFSPEAMYSNMKNNKDSDVSTSKILVTPRENKDQAGTGGRIMVSSASNTPKSLDAIESLKSGTGYTPREKAPKVEKVKKPRAASNSVSKKKAGNSSGEHGGISFSSDEERLG